MSQWTSAERADLINEARARTTWGESPESILEWMLSQDKTLTKDEARDILKPFVRERSRSMRKRGARDFLISAMLLAGGGIAAWLVLGYLAEGGEGAFAMLSLYACVAAMFLGGWFSSRAFDRLVFGARAEGADTD
jgi:hypothetical protein